MSEVHRFLMALKPGPEDIDLLGHVSNIVYVRWLQEIATAHWKAIATLEEQARLIWAVIRHEIDYVKACHLGETLTAETWADNPRGPRFDRLIRIFGPGGDTRMVSRTTWVLVDRARLKPLRVPKDLIDRFLGVEAPQEVEQA
ncbi:MAG: acyl-CoA thioesterase [Thermaurantiacus sp.]